MPGGGAGAPCPIVVIPGGAFILVMPGGADIPGGGGGGADIPGGADMPGGGFIVSSRLVYFCRFLFLFVEVNN